MNALANPTGRSFRCWRRAATALLASVALGGCATMHDRAPTQSVSPANRISLAKDVPLAREGWPEAHWWQHYADPQLDGLVDRALAQAPSLAVARARIDTARTQARLVEADTGAALAFSADIDRESVSANGFLGPFGKTNPAFGTTGPWYTAGTLGLSGEVDLDIWGKDRARVNAALGVAKARAAEEALAELLLSARIVDVYYEIQAQYAGLHLLEQARDIERESVAAHAARAAHGLEPRTRVELVREQQLAVDREIVATQARQRQLREVLRALLGLGGDEALRIEPRAMPAAAGQLPPALGYELLARRPDLQARRWLVESSLDQIDAAKAAFYPSFDIRAFAGFDALHLNDLLERSSHQFNLIPGLSLPIFDSGRLNAKLASARSQNDLLIAEYNQAIVDAVRDVAQDSIAVDSLQRQSAMQRERTEAARFAWASAQAHYGRGLSDRVTALEATLPLLTEQRAELSLQVEQIHAEVALTAALGGGYAAHADTTTARANDSSAPPPSHPD